MHVLLLSFLEFADNKISLSLLQISRKKLFFLQMLEIKSYIERGILLTPVLANTEVLNKVPERKYVNVTLCVSCFQVLLKSSLS